MKKIFIFLIIIFINNNLKAQQIKYQTEMVKVYPKTTILGKNFKPKQLAALLESSFDFETDYNVSIVSNKGYGREGKESKITIKDQSGYILYEGSIFLGDNMEKKLMFLLDPNSEISSDDANKICKNQLRELTKIYHIILSNAYLIEKKLKVYETNVIDKGLAKELNFSTAIINTNNTNNSSFIQKKFLIKDENCIEYWIKKYPARFYQYFRDNNIDENSPYIWKSGFSLRAFKGLHGKEKRVFLRCLTGKTWVGRNIVAVTGGTLLGVGGIYFLIKALRASIGDTTIDHGPSGY